jgi:hypothetical protein
MFKIGRKTKVNAGTRTTLVPMEHAHYGTPEAPYNLILPVQLNHGTFAVQQRCVVARNNGDGGHGSRIITLADRNPDSHHPADLAVRRVARVTTRTEQGLGPGAANNCSC